MKRFVLFVVALCLLVLAATPAKATHFRGRSFGTYGFGYGSYGAAFSPGYGVGYGVAAYAVPVPVQAYTVVAAPVLTYAAPTPPVVLAPSYDVAPSYVPVGVGYGVGYGAFYGNGIYRQRFFQGHRGHAVQPAGAFRRRR